MQLKDINFGDVDAKNEILKQSRRNERIFFESYSIPNKVSVDDIINGKVYFILGLKGTGKTALLRYLHDICQSNGDQSSVVLFKSHITEEDRAGLANSTGFEIIKTANGETFSQDFKEAWKWMIYKKIAILIKNINNPDPAAQLFGKLAGTEDRTVFDSMGSIFSSIKSGKVSLSAAMLGATTDIEIEFDSKKKSHSASLSDLNRLLSIRLNDIKLSKNIYLFFDELELFHQTSDQFDRDRRILRDLVYAISQINAESAEFGRKIFLCSTLRTEVLHSVLELGQEIGRDIDDYGVRLDWSEGNVSLNHPLMNLIKRKISKSINMQEADIWKTLFPEEINGKPFFDFILNSSYFRPRDLVRLLRIARDFRDNDDKFTVEHFEKSSAEYSKQTWLEITEELLAVYLPSEVAAIQRLFLGFHTNFSKLDIETRLKTKYMSDRVIQQLFQRHDLQKVLSDLYRIGVIGNSFTVKGASGRSRPRQRWIFRGNATLNDSERMAIHRSLWKHLSLV